jgi:hypothetical protein
MVLSGRRRQNGNARINEEDDQETVKHMFKPSENKGN